MYQWIHLWYLNGLYKTAVRLDWVKRLLHCKKNSQIHEHILDSSSTKDLFMQEVEFPVNVGYFHKPFEVFYRLFIALSSFK